MLLQSIPVWIWKENLGVATHSDHPQVLDSLIVDASLRCIKIVLNRTQDLSSSINR